jgi:FG-GAP-like repeat
MMIRARKLAIPALLCIAISVACNPTAPSTDSDATATTDNGGFQDGGGFFTVGDAGDTLPPLIPEVEDETETESFFLARSIDPASEDSAGPKFMDWGDIDNDGLPDIATAWNQSQVVQIHLQRRDPDGTVRFESTQIRGTAPIAIMAGLELADMDDDGQLDIVVLVKHRSFVPICPTNGLEAPTMFTGEIQILFAPPLDQLMNQGQWVVAEIFASDDPNPFPPGGSPPGRAPEDPDRVIDLPEDGGMTAMDVGDVDGDGLVDIMITSNRPDPPCYDSSSDLELYLNPGRDQARTGSAWTEIVIDRDIPPLKDLILTRIDDDNGDGVIDQLDDIDVVFTRPLAASQNIAWRRNPLLEAGPGAVADGSMWQSFTVGQVDGGADVMTLGDIDRDGFDDIVVRSNAGQVVQWFRHPGADDALNVTQVLRQVPWSVFVLLEVPDRVPRGMALGDINFDGQPEVIVGSEGSVLWLDSSTATSVFDSWTSNLIADDTQLDSNLFAADGPAFINDVLVLDIDCDGANDILATIDRRDLSGLGSDVLVWFRNVLKPSDVGIDQPLVPVCPQRSRVP